MHSEFCSYLHSKTESYSHKHRPQNVKIEIRLWVAMLLTCSTFSQLYMIKLYGTCNCLKNIKFIFTGNSLCRGWLNDEKIQFWWYRHSSGKTETTVSSDNFTVLNLWLYYCLYMRCFFKGSLIQINCIECRMWLPRKKKKKIRKKLLDQFP